MNKLLKIKNIINLIFKHFSIFFDFSTAFIQSFSSLIDKIEFSDKDNCYNIILIRADMTVEYKIWGI